MTTSGSPTSLTQDGNRYAFFQAMRLLRLQLGDDTSLRDGVRVRPNLSLGFPETDIQGISLDPFGRYRIEANFFGLYGVASPLPTFYTEDLIDEHMEGRSSMRDFLDIIHALLYPLLFHAWEKYRIWLAISEHGSTERLEQLRALVGMHGRSRHTDRSEALLPHAGNFGWRPRSALGLQGFLHDWLGKLPVRVLPCVQRQVGIPLEARCRLGVQASTLGEDASLGRLVADSTGALEIKIGPMSVSDFRALLPGEAQHTSIIGLILHYLEKPLHCELRLSLNAPEVRGPCLGRSWNRLGLETWLGGADGTCRPVRHHRRAWPAAVRIPLPYSPTALFPPVDDTASRHPFPVLEQETRHHDAG